MRHGGTRNDVVDHVRLKTHTHTPVENTCGCVFSCLPLNTVEFPRDHTHAPVTIPSHWYIPLVHYFLSTRRWLGFSHKLQVLWETGAQVARRRYLSQLRCS